MPLRLPFATFLQNISPNQLHSVLRKHSVRAVPRTQIAIVVLSTAWFANTKSLLEGTSSQTYESWICFSYNIEQFSHISPRATPSVQRFHRDMSPENWWTWPLCAIFGTALLNEQSVCFSAEPCPKFEEPSNKFELHPKSIFQFSFPTLLRNMLFH